MTTPTPTPPPSKYTINLTGDIMLGRLIDQLSPIHNNDPSSAQHIAHLIPKPYSHSSSQSQSQAATSPNTYTPWTNTLPLLHSASLTLINLETAVTTHETPWPDKVFNYRMHPANIRHLTDARVDYCGLANNHTLDFGVQGLRETVETVRGAGFAFAGAGDSAEEAAAPAMLGLPSAKDVERGFCQEQERGKYTIHIYAASDHPAEWGSVPAFHLLDYTPTSKRRLKTLLTTPREKEPSLKIFSIHWGPNYAWRPAGEIREMAHFLIEECGVDLVHGHSAHHVQGVERFGRGVIVYGCGDFVDDYAVVPGGWRNDLGAVWRVGLREEEGEGREKLGVERLEVFPTRIEGFRVSVLDGGDADHGWVVGKVRSLSEEFGTEAQADLGDEGQLEFEFH